MDSSDSLPLPTRPALTRAQRYFPSDSLVQLGVRVPTPAACAPARAFNIEILAGGCQLIRLAPREP